MLTLLANAVTPDTVRVVDSTLALSTAYAFKSAMYTWLLAAIVGFGVALVMKFLYLHIKSSRVADADASKSNNA